jgi:hypothetical protein
MLFIPLVAIGGALLAAALYIVLLRVIRRHGGRAITYVQHQVDDPVVPAPPPSAAELRRQRIEEWDRKLEGQDEK